MTPPPPPDSLHRLTWWSRHSTKVRIAIEEYLFKMDNNLCKHNFLHPTSFKPSLVSKLSLCHKLSLCLKISLDPKPSLYLKTSSANSSSFPLSPAIPWVTLPTPSSQHL